MMGITVVFNYVFILLFHVTYSYHNGVLGVTNASASSELNPDSCGVSIGCFRDPADCSWPNCTYFLMWKDAGDNMIEFSMAAHITSDDGPNPWTDVGFNTNTKMPGTMAIDCIYDSSKQQFTIQSSYNEGYDNQVLKNPEVGFVAGSLGGQYQDNVLQCSFSHYIVTNSTSADHVPNFSSSHSYYLIMAKGPSQNGIKLAHPTIPAVSPTTTTLESHPNLGGVTSNQLFYRIHGILNILGWVVFSTIGMIISRYMKPLAPRTLWCGAAIWFRIHTACMMIAFILTAAAFVIIFVEMKTYFPVEDVHPVLGVIVMALSVLNVLLGVFRPSPSNENRLVFNWAHSIIALLAQSTAGAAMVYGVTFEQMGLERWVFWLMLAWVISRISIDIILTLYNYISAKCCYGDPYYNEMYDDMVLSFNKKPANVYKKVPVLVYIVVCCFIPITVGVAATLITEIVKQIIQS